MTNHPFGSPSLGRAFGNGDAGGYELDGLRVVFDQKVGLYPANLQKKIEPAARKSPARPRAAMSLQGPFYGRR